MGEAGGLNLYGYVGGDPINGIDPYGLWTFRDALDGFTAWGSRKRDACKDWVNSGAGGLASQLGATAVSTVFDLTLGTLIDTPGAIAHFGEGAGTFSGDPSLKNLPGLLSDVLIAAGAASGTGALASKAGQVVSKTAACKVGEKAVEQACSTQAKAAAAGVGEAAKATANSTVGRILGRLDQYPQIIDPRTGRHIPFPSDVGSIVPQTQRVTWGAKERGEFIGEWYRRGYETPRGGWGNYDMHHIKPLEFGGGNEFWNLAPVERQTHQNMFNSVWRNFSGL